MQDEAIDYGIKYKVIKQKDGLFFLFPKSLVEGYASTDIFYNEHEYRVLRTPLDLAAEYVVDNIYSGKALRELYEFDDIEFLKEYFLTEERDKILIISVAKGQMKKVKVEASLFEGANIQETYEIEQGKPCVTLNSEAINELLSVQDIEEIRTRLLRFKSLVRKMKAKEKEGTTKVLVKNGSITQIESKRKIIVPGGKESLDMAVRIDQPSGPAPSDISVTGLERYIKERIFGHDKEIRKLAKSIIMNYTATPDEKSEPILLIGPTGTGKTETMHAISSYLDIPLVEVNSANLVPQGIKGMSLEDCLYSLITATNYNVEQAERGIVFLDEFDKLGRITSDYKSPVVQILLKFIEGGTFYIDKPTDDYTFDTRMLIKIVAGAFSDLFEEEKNIGFGTKPTGRKEFKPQNITEKEYFGKELVTRIPHILLFEELSREEKKRAILYSKISEYYIKKQRYARQFQVDLQIDDSYIEAILDLLSKDQRSMRELNNLIIESLDEAEYELLANHQQYHTLRLTRETVEDNRQFHLS